MDSMESGAIVAMRRSRQTSGPRWTRYGIVPRQRYAVSDFGRRTYAVPYSEPVLPMSNVKRGCAAGPTRRVQAVLSSPIRPNDDGLMDATSRGDVSPIALSSSVPFPGVAGKPFAVQTLGATWANRRVSRP